MKVLMEHARHMNVNVGFPCNLDDSLQELTAEALGWEDAFQQNTQWRCLDWIAASVVALHETQVRFSHTFFSLAPLDLLTTKC